MIAIDFGRFAGVPQTMTTFVWSSGEGGAPPPVTVEELVSTSIDNWFVIDYRVRKMRPINAQEWRQLKQLFAAIQRGEREKAQHARADERHAGRFTRNITRNLYAQARSERAKRQARGYPRAVRTRL